MVLNMQSYLFHFGISLFSSKKSIKLFACFFSNSFFSKKFFQEYMIRLSNSLDAQRYVRPDLGPNCLQKTIAEESTGKELS